MKRFPFTIRPLAPIFFVWIFSMTQAYAAGGAAPSGPVREATSSDVVLLVVYILMALVFSFLCSVAEAVLLSITPSYIAGLRDSKPKRAILLKKLRQDNVDRSLAAILTLNTIAHTVGAIGSGAKATIVFGSAWFGAFSAVMTLLILFLSEIIPKTLGALYWRSLSGPTAFFVKGLTTLLFPLVWISERLTKLLSRGKEIHVFNRDEFVAMAHVGEQGGQINEDESRIIRNLFRLESLTAQDIMTPRTVVLALQENTTVDEAMEAHPNLRFSRIPIFTTDIDQPSGMVLKDDILKAKAQGKGLSTLLEFKRELTAVPYTMHLSALLEFFLDNRRHVALVVDEYGGTAGLVSLEDVVETLLGMEIVDEADRTEDMQVLARKQWEKRAKALGIEID